MTLEGLVYFNFYNLFMQVILPNLLPLSVYRKININNENRKVMSGTNWYDS